MKRQRSNDGWRGGRGVGWENEGGGKGDGRGERGRGERKDNEVINSSEVGMEG